MSDSFFITGMLRSGTTLLDKTLCCHPDLSVLSQPFIKLFIEAKKAFYNDICGYSIYHVLHNYFNEESYSVNDLNEFLSSFDISKELIHEVVYDYLKSMNNKIICKNSILNIPSGNIDNVYKKLISSLKHKEYALKCGAKEVMCEEFMPYFVKSGIKCILIVRDPRDIIASLNFGNGKNYGGNIRPTLFNIRNWRKSIAFLIELEGHENFLSLKYEDLVSNPNNVLNKIAKFLDVDNYKNEFFEKSIYDQNGSLWFSNSSHMPEKGITNKSVGSFRNRLSDKVVSYVEATCYPEMKVLGYEFNNKNLPNFSMIKEFKEVFPIERSEFNSYYEMEKENVEAEINRLKLLDLDNLSSDVIKKYFICQSAYIKYKELND